MHPILNLKIKNYNNIITLYDLSSKNVFSSVIDILLGVVIKDIMSSSSFRRLSSCG